MSGNIGTFWLVSGCLGEGLLGSNEEVDIVKVTALRWVHHLSPPLDECVFVCYHYDNEGVRS